MLDKERGETMKKLIPCVFVGCVLISLMADALPVSAGSSEWLAIDEIALPLDDLPPSWSLAGKNLLVSEFSLGGVEIYGGLQLKFAKENCGEIDQWIYVRSTAEGAKSDFRGTHFTDQRWLVDHPTVGDESEFWICQNVAHIRFRVQNFYVEIVLYVNYPDLWTEYPDFKAYPSMKDYILWLTSVVESKILDLGSRVDFWSPTAKIVSPSDRSYLKGVVDITAAGADVNFKQMELHIDNSLEQTWTTGGTQTYNWDTTRWADSDHTITLIAYDKAGNTTEASVTVAVNNIPDDDGDGILDEWELAHGLDPNDPTDAPLDFDGDGLNNLDEYLLGTNPTNPDSDGDGLGDGVEVKIGLNPLSWDTDGDGIGDGVEFAINFENCEAEPLPDNSIKVQVFWGDYRMDVISDSTVLGVTFDSDSGQLTVGVSGPDGTTGTCDITVPKALISSTSDVSVYLDDQPIEFTRTQDETNYHLHMEYAHSEHDLVVSLTPRGAIPPPTALVLVIALIVVMGVLCAYFIRKKLLG